MEELFRFSYQIPELNEIPITGKWKQNSIAYGDGSGGMVKEKDSYDDPFKP